MVKPKVILILGQTATGKSQLAIALAEKINAEIISADSMQVYRGMDIGTAKPPKEELKLVPHHLIDVIAPDQYWTVSDFKRECEKLLAEITARRKTPIIVGGTGLYLWSLLEGLTMPESTIDNEFRAEMDRQNVQSLYDKLSKIDPLAAEKINKNDKKRIIRALEVFELTGKPISSMQKKEGLNEKYDFKIFGLQMDREKLYQRINERVDKMLQDGLVDEVKGLIAKGYSKTLPVMQALGYKEVVKYLGGEWDYAQMAEELKKRTRNFARRQMTWFRRFKDVCWVDVNDNTLKRIGDILQDL